METLFLIFAFCYQRLVLLGLVLFSGCRLIYFWLESEDGREWSARWKGKFGEWVTRRRLDALLADGQTGFYLHDVYLPLGPEGLTQVDFVLFHRNGVFVIETKFWTGMLYGDAGEMSWTLKSPFGHSAPYNPLRQNAGHVRAVQAVLGDAVRVLGVVHLTGGVKLGKSLPVSVVVSPLPLRPAIIQMSPVPLYSMEQLAQFRDQVAASDPCVADPSLKVVHRVKARAAKLAREQADRLGASEVVVPASAADAPVFQAEVTYVLPIGSASAASPRCPGCGAAMTLRQVRKGPRAGKMGYGCDAFCGGFINVD